MQLNEIIIKIPRELPMLLHKNLEDVGKDIRRQAAIRYYKQRILSMGKAADLAELTRIDFMDLLKFYGEPIFDYSKEELEEVELDSKRLEGILDAP